MARNETVLLGLNQLTNWGILTTDATLIVTGWNQWLEINGERPAAEIVGRPLLEAFPELVARRLDQVYRQALDGQVIVLSQRLHKYLLPMPPTLDGTGLSHMQQSVRIAPLVEDQVVVGTITVIEDVTERVAHDGELAARARQQSAVAALGQRALTGGELTELLNEAAALIADTLEVECCAILERVADENSLLLRAGVGWESCRVGRATVDAGHGSHAGLTLTAGGPIVVKDFDSEARFPTPPLIKEHGLVSGMTVPLSGGKSAVGMVGVYSRRQRMFSDDHLLFLQAAANILGTAIQRKNLESELQVRVEQLAETDHRKDEFLAMLAHELRNPLAPIRNALHMVRMRGAERRQVVGEAYDIIERQVEYLVRLVDDLLDVSRITRGKIQLQTERVDLAAVVERAIEGSRPLIEARGHTLEVVLPEVAVIVDADPLRLAQVFWNLLNNAAKYTPEGGRIALTVERTAPQKQSGEGEVVVRVRDTGMGIPAEMLPKVFDLFTQMDRTLDRAEGGLGIGLTLVRRLTELHRGTAQASSGGPGLGSEFVVRLPISSTSEIVKPTEKLAATDEPRQSAARRRILVVDDNRDSADSLAKLLQLCGHDVRAVNNGQTALEIAADYRPEVVLLDIGLPGMNGLEVCRHLRELPEGSQMLIVAMTGYGQMEDRAQSKEAGFNAHLVKPVDLETLQEMLARPGLSGDSQGSW